MQRKLFFITMILFSFVIACTRSDYNKTETGAMMKFYTENKNNEKPELGDIVVLDLIQKIADSVIFSSADYDGPFEFLLEEPAFHGDIMSALLCMHLNDHVSLIFPVDSLFKSIGEELPSFVASGTLTEMDIVLKEIIKKEVYEEEVRQQNAALKIEESIMLSPYYSNDKYTITSDSLIILNLDKGKGRLPNPGDIMKVYFTLQTMAGDTLLNFFEDKPYELVYGDKALGEGFCEGLGLVSKGGEAEFIIPSSLAFGSEGFEGFILPYTPFKFKLKVFDIMTSEEYESEQKILMEKQEAENAKRLQEEPMIIANYLKQNNLNIAPTSSGLYYFETNAGNGESVAEGDIVSIYYTIYNIDGQVIDSNVIFGEPLPFIHGNGDMIPGIDEAVGYMKVGGSARLVVPSHLGFGNISIDENLPANSTLIVDLDLVDLKK